MLSLPFQTHLQRAKKISYSRGAIRNLFVCSVHSQNIFFAIQGCEASDEFKCAPNETYKQDCNTCVCSGDGKTAICSQIACPLLDLTTTEPPLEQVESNNHVCTPNDVKMEVWMTIFIRFSINSKALYHLFSRIAIDAVVRRTE